MKNELKTHSNNVNNNFQFNPDEKNIHFNNNNENKNIVRIILLKIYRQITIKIIQQIKTPNQIILTTIIIL